MLQFKLNLLLQLKNLQRMIFFQHFLSQHQSSKLSSNTLSRFISKTRERIFFQVDGTISSTNSVSSRVLFKKSSQVFEAKGSSETRHQLRRYFTTCKYPLSGPRCSLSFSLSLSLSLFACSHTHKHTLLLSLLASNAPLVTVKYCGQKQQR